MKCAYLSGDNKLPPLVGTARATASPAPRLKDSVKSSQRIYPTDSDICETSNMIENCQHECGFHMDTYNSDRRATVPSASQATGRVFVSSDDLSESSALESLSHRNHSTLAPSCGATLDRDKPPAQRSRRRRGDASTLVRRLRARRCQVKRCRRAAQRPRRSARARPSAAARSPGSPSQSTRSQCRSWPSARS